MLGDKFMEHTYILAKNCNKWEDIILMENQNLRTKNSAWAIRENYL